MCIKTVHAVIKTRKIFLLSLILLQLHSTITLINISDIKKKKKSRASVALHWLFRFMKLLVDCTTCTIILYI